MVRRACCVSWGGDMAMRPRQSIRRARAFGFALWASSLGRLPSIEEIEGYFGITRRRALDIHHEWVRAVTQHQSANPKPGGNRQHR